MQCMRTYFGWFLLPLLASSSALGQKQDLAANYAAYIDSNDLRTHLTVLASDAYEGRETGKKGQHMAAEYIRTSLKEDGCSVAPGMKGYEQFFEVIETIPGGKLQWGKAELRFKTDFVYFAARRQTIFSNIPIYTSEGAQLAQPENYVLVHRLESNDFSKELNEIRKNQPKEAKAIILVTSNYKDIYDYLEHYVTTKSMRLKDAPEREEVPVIVVRAEAIQSALGKKFTWLARTGKKKKLRKPLQVAELNGNVNEQGPVLTSSNVLGFIPGSDPILAKEVVVITAHYDHIGIENGVVYNGADDDGTGTVALLEIAEAFGRAKREGNAPRRSVLIMTVSGEEKGLLGSSYYVEHPVIPLDKTIADLNIDMIGRNDIAHEKESDYIYIIGSNMISTDLHNANENANRKYTRLKLDYKFNRLDDPNQFYYRSDHYNFAKNGVPSIFYFSGIHEDYHQPGDDIEKINFSKVEKVARLVFYTAWSLANDNQRPRPDF